MRNNSRERVRRSEQRSPRYAQAAPQRTPAFNLQIPRERAVCGKNCVLEVVRHAADQIERLLVVSNKLELVQGVAGAYTPQVVDEQALTKALGTDSHQGMCAILRSDNRGEVKSFLETYAGDQRCTIVALDGVEDQHNIGAIFRAAECFGIDAVMWSKGMDISPAAAKVSVGAVALVPALRPSNLVQALELCKKAGFWVIGATGGATAQELKAFDFPARSVVVLGAEGEGLSRLVAERCDFLVKIPMVGKIDSLNVSQAAAVLFYALANSLPSKN